MLLLCYSSSVIYMPYMCSRVVVVVAVCLFVLLVGVVSLLVVSMLKSDLRS